MKAKAQARYIRVTPQKARRIVNAIRGKDATDALNLLRFAPQAVATDVSKIVVSALANAQQAATAAGETFNEADMVIDECFVDEGPTMKRYRPRAQGRGARILKRSSHITVIVADKEEARQGRRAR